MSKMIDNLEPVFSISNDKVEGEFTAEIRNGNLTAYVFGELAGGILGRSVFSADEYLDKFEKNLSSYEEIEDLIKNAVGAFYFVVTGGDEVKVYVSMSAPSLIVHHEDLTYRFYDNEYAAYGQHGHIDTLNEEQLISHCFSHQILLRTPFTTLFDNLLRLPSGCFYSLSEQYPKSYLWDKSRYSCDDSYEQFKFVFENTVSLLCSQKSTNNKLLFSGGIDSAILLAALKNKGMPVEAVHIPYSGVESPDVKLAEEIAAHFNVPFQLTDLSEADNDFIHKLAFSGPGTVVGPQYLKSRLSAESFGADTVDLLSGQNADTLYHVDTYAPSSSMPRLVKWVLILLGIKKRVYYSNIYLDEHKRNEKKWRIWPFSLSSKHKNKSFSEYIKSLCLPMKEHVRPFFEESNNYKVSCAYKELRSKELYELLWEDYSDSKNKIDWDLRAIKVFRWFRTVFNVSVNYQNNYMATGLNRIIPYNEGPLANFLMDKAIGPYEVIFVKNYSYRYFKESVGVSYDSFISKSRGMLFSIKFYSSRIMRKLGFGKNKINQRYGSELVILRELISENSGFLLDFVKNEESKTELLKIYDQIESSQDDFDKNKMMLLCRTVNMHLFLSNLGLKEND